MQYKSYGPSLKRIDSTEIERRNSSLYSTERLKHLVEKMAETIAKKLALLSSVSDYNTMVESLMPQNKGEGESLLKLHDKLSAWPIDVLRTQPILFASQILNFEATDYQVPLFTAYGALKARRITNRWSRQSGKTKSSCALVLADCILNARYRWMITGPAKRVAEVVMNKMQEHYFAMNPLLARALIEEPLKQHWTFRNGSSIIATPNALHALRGDTLHGALIEEYDFVKDAGTVMESIVLPMLATTDGMLIANSTPWDVKGEFAKLWCTAECQPERGEHRPGAFCGQWSQFYVTWEQAVRAGIIKDSFARDTILPLKDADYAKYQREWMAQWSEEINTYFPVQLLTQATDPMLVYEGFESQSWTGDWYFGIDLGEEVDHSFLVGIRRRSEISDDNANSQWEVAHRKMWPLHTPLSEIRGHCAALYDKVDRCLGLYVDATNNMYFAQDLQSDVGVTEGVRFTKSGDNWPLSIGKESFFSYLKTGLRSGRLSMAYDSELYEHLNVVKFEMGKDGHYKFGHPSGTHDDGAFGIGLAWYGTHDKSTEDIGGTTTSHNF